MVTFSVRMAASSPFRYPSQLKQYPVLTIHLSVTRSPQRLRVLDAAKRSARARNETLTTFLLRALAREVARCQQELNGTVAGQMKLADDAEAELLRYYSKEELGFR